MKRQDLAAVAQVRVSFPRTMVMPDLRVVSTKPSMLLKEIADLDEVIGMECAGGLDN
jgi:hypothetical protein